MNKLGSKYQRYPCEATGGITAPFAEEIIDPSTGKPFCGTNPAEYYVPAGHTYGIENKYVTGGTEIWRNSKIIQEATNYQGAILKYCPANLNNEYTGGWCELYAQAFAYEAYTRVHLPVAESAQPQVNGMFKNAYFQCTLEWAADVVKEKAVPPSPAAEPPGILEKTCAEAVPSWYIKVLGK